MNIVWNGFMMMMKTTTKKIQKQDDALCPLFYTHSWKFSQMELSAYIRSMRSSRQTKCETSRHTDIRTPFHICVEFLLKCLISTHTHTDRATNWHRIKTGISKKATPSKVVLSLIYDEFSTIQNQLLLLLYTVLCDYYY